MCSSQAGLLREAMELGQECRDTLNSWEKESLEQSAEVVEKISENQMRISGFLGHLVTVLVSGHHTLYKQILNNNINNRKKIYL